MVHSKTIAVCCLAVILALQVVGAVSHGTLRHIVQTLPLWFPLAWGFRGRGPAKWAALPCLIFWLGIMICIWLFLLGWARLVSGHFSPVEVAMTFVVGAASMVGIIGSLRSKALTPGLAAAGWFVLFAAFQLAAFRLSLTSYIASH